MAKKDANRQVSKKRKVLIIIGIVLVVLIAAGTGVALRWWQDISQQQRGDSPEVSQEETATLPTVVDDLQNLRTEGDQEAFDQQLATALENPDYDDPTRALLFIQQGNAAYDNRDFNAALEAYLQADELDPSSQTAQLVGFAYQELGNNVKAVEFYHLTIERLDPNNILYEADRAYFEDRIRRLQG
jgi:tetratricopeptide (TPR) repeat protein